MKFKLIWRSKEKKNGQNGQTKSEMKKKPWKFSRKKSRLSQSIAIKCANYALKNQTINISFFFGHKSKCFLIDFHIFLLAVRIDSHNLIFQSSFFAWCIFVYHHSTFYFYGKNFHFIKLQPLDVFSLFKWERHKHLRNERS